MSSRRRAVSYEDRAEGGTASRWTAPILLALSLFLPVRAGSQTSPSPDPEKLAQALADPELWGPDFRAAVGAVPTWRSLGEASIAVFPDRVVGQARLATPQAADTAVARAAEALRGPLRAARAETRGIMGAIGPRVPFRAERLRFDEDESLRLAMVMPDARFLAPDLKVAKVRERLGPAEDVRHKLIDTEGERRPTVLTLHSYFGGSVVFVETDMSPRPGGVDRVQLDTEMLATTLFEQVTP